MLWTASEEIRTRRGKFHVQNCHRWWNVDQPVHARDQSSVDDVENPRIAIPKEIQNEPVHQEADIRGILRFERGDLSPCSSPGTDGGCRILYEVELEYCTCYTRS